MATKIRGTGWSAMLIRSITLRAPPPPSTDQPPVVPFLSQGGRGWTGWLAWSLKRGVSHRSVIRVDFRMSAARLLTLR